MSGAAGRTPSEGPGRGQAYGPGAVLAAPPDRPAPARTESPAPAVPKATDETGPWALATGGGKDATLALYRARTAGLRVPFAFNVFEGNTGLVRFHGVPEALVRAQAEALGLDLVAGHTHPRDYPQVHRALLDELRDRGTRGLLYGNIHLADVQAWYQERSRAAGLAHREPLWGEDPAALVREFIQAGFRTTVTGVNLEHGDPGWLGRELDRELVEEMEAAGVDPCGEYGEYHTFVWDGPEFRTSVGFRIGRTLELEGHRFLELAPEGFAD